MATMRFDGTVMDTPSKYPDWFWLVVLMTILIIVTSCTTDYRTDEERNSGVVLTEAQIEGRKEVRRGYNEMTQRHLKRETDRFRMQRAYIDCGNRSIVECL